MHNQYLVCMECCLSPSIPGRSTYSPFTQKKMKHDLQGPWLNLKEVTQKTGLVRNEILYHIQERNITPVLYAYHRPFLAVSKRKSQIVGHASFRYCGPIAVDSQAINDIVAQDHALIGACQVRLLRTGNICDWQKNLPYEGCLPNGIVDDWEPKNSEEINTWETIHLPVEHASYASAESALVEHVPENFPEDDFFNCFANRYLIRSPKANYVYGTDYNSAYNQNDLRIPSSALKLFNNSEIKMVDPVMEIPEQKQRTNDLHQVITRLFKQFPNAKSGFLWNELRKDIGRQKPQFDREELIESMDHAAIIWVSAKGIQQTLKKTSFQTLVSRIRRKNTH